MKMFQRENRKCFGVTGFFLEKTIKPERFWRIPSSQNSFGVCPEFLEGFGNVLGPSIIFWTAPRGYSHMGGIIPLFWGDIGRGLPPTFGGKCWEVCPLWGAAPLKGGECWEGVPLGGSPLHGVQPRWVGGLFVGPLLGSHLQASPTPSFHINRGGREPSKHTTT
jgi:hypothetical protein